MPSVRESDFGTKPETPSRHSKSQFPALTLVLRDSWFSEVRSILFSKQKASGHGGLGICEVILHIQNYLLLLSQD